MYEEDIPKEQRDHKGKGEMLYKSGHLGPKIVEAYFIPSARSDNNEANRLRILKYVYDKRYKAVKISERGFARVELTFENFLDANSCLTDKMGRAPKIVNFEIPERSKTCKGVVYGWDAVAPLDELVDSMSNTERVIEIERLKRRRFDRENKRVIMEETGLILVTWEGSRVPEDIEMYGGLTKLRIRPYMRSVLQCFNCYRFGHLKVHCKGKKICWVCGGDFHGYCDREVKCVNCGMRHRPTDR